MNPLNLWGQWDLNLADKWGQFIELNKAGPRGF